jgi:hypothetical protein
MLEIKNTIEGFNNMPDYAEKNKVLNFKTYSLKIQSRKKNGKKE